MITFSQPRTPLLLSTAIVLAAVGGMAVSLLSLWLFHSGAALIAGAVILPLALAILSTAPDFVTKLTKLAPQLRWWHLLWLLAILSGLVFRVRDTGTIEDNPVDGWALYRAGLMAVVALVLLERLATRRLAWASSLFQGLIGLLALYALFGQISTLWSIYPSWTFYKSTEFLIDVALAAAIVSAVTTTDDLKTLFDWTWLYFGALAGTVCAGALIWPSQAIIHGIGLIGIQIAGVLPAVSANGVGDLGSTLAVVGFCRLLFPSKSHLFYLAVTVVGLIMLVLSQSRSPLTAFLLAAILVLLAARRVGVAAALALLTAGVFSLTSFAATFAEFFLRGQGTQLFTSLSGRTHWWTVGLDFLKDRPLVGYGAYAGSRFTVLAELGYTTTSSIHNAWLETLLGTGIVGLLPVIGAVVGTWLVLVWFLFRVPKNSLEHRLLVEAVALLCLESVRSIFTVDFVWHPPETDFLLVLIYAEYLRRRRRATIRQASLGGRLTRSEASARSRGLPLPLGEGPARNGV